MQVNKNIENIIEDNMMGYAVSVLSDRCLPRFEDGLKPVHRRILWTMYKMKAFHFTKSANVCGQVMKFHPHGSSYGTAVGMVQKDNNLIPMLTGKGSFGQYSSRDLQCAADRYTEIKLSEISLDMMKDFEKGLVEFIPNYDGTEMMPEVMPVKFPNVLCVAQSGIGVGFSSSTMSFNLKEVCDETINYIRTKKHTNLIPDFAMGGMILDEPEVFDQINKVGGQEPGKSATVKLRGKAEIDGNDILITEIPYGSTREAIIEKIVDLAKTARMKEVIDVKDLTGIKGMLIAVTARRGTDMKILLEKLYRFTPLEATYSANMNVLINNFPKVLGVHEIIEKWSIWRRNCIKNGIEYDTKKMKERLHLLRGLEKILLNIDKAIDIIRFSKGEEIEPNLIKEFEVDEIQARYVSDMKLRNINNDYISKRILDIRQLENDIKVYEDILVDESKQDELVIQGLEETKNQFGQERRTQIIKPGQTVKIVIPQEEIIDYPVIIHLTKDGYCYKFKGTQVPSLKPGDSILKTFETTNKSEILIFSKDRIIYKLPINRIEETRVTNIGVYLPTLVRQSKIDIISYSILDKKIKFVVMAYSNNRLTKINLKALEAGKNILKNAYCHSQELVDILTFEEESKIRLITTETEIEVLTQNITLTNSRGACGVYFTRKGILQKVEII